MTTKSDVYAFGVVLAELVTGLRALVRNNKEANKTKSLISIMRKAFKSNDLESLLEKIIGPYLKDNYPIEEVCKLANISLWCLSEEPLCRREMRGILPILSQIHMTSIEWEASLGGDGEVFTEKENLCLYWHPNGSWEVVLPAEEVPPEMPEPALRINFARDGMHRRDWLSLVTVHSDSWLLSLTFFFSAHLNGKERKRLFSMINDHPTVLESLSERKHGRDNKSAVDNGGRSKHSVKRANNDVHTKNSKPAVADDRNNDDDEHSETLCGTCSGLYNTNEFWIACDIRERWFHGNCVRITPVKAEHIKHYKCPDCSSKKSRQ